MSPLTGRRWTAVLNFIVTEFHGDYEGWKVEAVDPITSEVYSAEFFGAQADTRARAYANWMNDTLSVRDQVEEVRNEIIRLRKEIEQLPKLLVRNVEWVDD